MAATKVPWSVGVVGRRVLRGVVGVAVGGTFLAHYLPQTHMLDTLRQVVQSYRSGLPRPVAPEVLKLVQEVMEEIQMPEEERERIQTFMVVGFDYYHAGCSTSSTGALLGLPISCQWGDVADFSGVGIMLDTSPVAWSTEAGQKLKQSLILSERGKKFALARQLYRVGISHPFSSALTPTLSLGLACGISYWVNRRLNLYTRPRVVRLCLYVIAGLFGYSFYILGSDVAVVGAEEWSDKAAAAAGREYAEGGVEFYQKVMERNIALRELMGDDGPRMFTAKGNDEVLLRTKHLPYNIRLDNMKKQLQNYRKEEEEEEERRRGGGGGGGGGGGEGGGDK